MENSTISKAKIPVIGLEDAKVYTDVKSLSIKNLLVSRYGGGFKVTTPFYRGDFYTIFIVAKPGITFYDERNSYELLPGDVIFTCPEKIRAWSINSFDHELAYSVCFTGDSVLKADSPERILDELFTLEVNPHPLIKIDDDIQKGLLSILEIIQTLYTSDKPKKQEIIIAYLGILLIELNSQVKERENKVDTELDTSYSISLKFKTLLNQYYRERKSVADYADLLGISPGHLSDTVKRIFGRSPIDYINERSLIYAKILLSKTDLTVSEIAYHMNFEDSSYFAKFFKKHTDNSPGYFRHQYIDE